MLSTSKRSKKYLESIMLFFSACFQDDEIMSANFINNVDSPYCFTGWSSKSSEPLSEKGIPPKLFEMKSLHLDNCFYSRYLNFIDLLLKYCLNFSFITNIIDFEDLPFHACFHSNFKPSEWPCQNITEHENR